MTDTATAETAAVNPAIVKAQEIVAQMTALQAQYNSAGNTGKMVHDLRTDPNTADANVKAYQEALEKANAEILDWTNKIDAHIQSTMPKSEIDPTKIKSDFSELSKKAKATVVFVREVLGLDLTLDIPTLKGGKVGTGSGGKRPRIADVFVNGVSLAKDGKASFGTLAAHLKGVTGSKDIEVKDLHEAAFKAAGTDDLSTLNGKSIEFNYSVTVDGKTTDFEILIVTPDATEKSADASETETVIEASGGTPTI